jgi:hypothetical protein
VFSTAGVVYPGMTGFDCFFPRFKFDKLGVIGSDYA